MPDQNVWLNGRIIPMSEARVDLEDRGFQFADGVYEVIRVYNGVPFTLEAHLDRLVASATALDITLPLELTDLAAEIRQLISRDHVLDAMVYLQLTRGSAARNHLITPGMTPTLLFYTRPLPPLPAPGEGDAARLLIVPDERWKRCWIKSIALLPNILAKNLAAKKGFDEALFVEDGLVSECSSSNFFAVIDGVVVTHPVGPKVLPGITREQLRQSAGELAIPFAERPIRLEEAQGAQELFITSTTREITWVSHLDEKQIATRPGPITLALHRALKARVEQAIAAASKSTPADHAARRATAASSR